MRACTCGCTLFNVRYQQIEEYNVCIDIDSGEWINDGDDGDIVSVDMCEDTEYVCDDCGKEYKHLEDIPEIAEDN